MDELLKNLRVSINQVLLDINNWNTHCDEINNHYVVSNKYFDEKFPKTRRIYNRIDNVKSLTIL